MTKLRVLALDGRYIPGWGSRICGEIIELPDDLANQYLAAYPDDYEKVEEA
jgi:hypothetical protein